MHDVLVVEGLGFSFPQSNALFENLCFSIREGEALGLFGSSGSGKSTLAKCLMRLLPFTGCVKIPEKQIQIVFQDSVASLNPAWIVEYLLEEPLKIHRKDLTGRERRNRVRELLDWVGLEGEIRKRLPSELSGGQRQRVNIARAIACEPKLLILDEPVSQLAVSVQSSILKLLIRLQEEKKLSYLLISHDLDVLKMVCHRILKMENGGIVNWFSE